LTITDCSFLRFEEYRVQGLYLGNQAVMSLFATGRTTGTVLDSGEGVTHTVPIYEGYAIPHFIEEIPICGRDLTNYLVTLLNKKYPSYLPLNSEEKRKEAVDVAIKIKEMHGKVAHDFDAELKTAEDENITTPKKYKLPGSQTITVNR
jgi:actin-related protein